MNQSTINFVEPPDLIVTDINYSPSLPSAGENIIFTATIKNIGYITPQKCEDLAKKSA